MTKEQSGYRCPRPDCGENFHDTDAVPGRLIECPHCERSMNARPLSMERELLRREEAAIRFQADAVVMDSSDLPPRLPLAILADNLRSLWNVGSLFRTSDACGVRMLSLSGITGTPPRDSIAKTALSAEQAVRWRYRAEALTALTELMADGYTPVALETTTDAVPLEEFHWPEQPCLVVGNEVRGISPEVLDACNLRVLIPMRGVKESLNVAVAFGIAAHHAARQLESRVTSKQSSSRSDRP